MIIVGIVVNKLIVVVMSVLVMLGVMFVSVVCCMFVRLWNEFMIF